MTNKAPEAPAAAALRAKSTETPTRRKIAVAGGGLAAVALVVGGFFGVNAANDYRAGIEASEQAAADYYTAAAEQVELANAAADDAEESAEAASAAVTSAQAAEEAAAAQAAAEQAAAAAAQAAAAQKPSANTGGNEGGLPSGAVVPLNEFGSPDTTKCASSSASNNSSGIAVCD